MITNICLYYEKGISGSVLKPFVIIGIDPGLAHTGWGVVSSLGSRISPIAYGCITTANRDDLPTRLAIIHDNLCEIIDRYNPAALSAEGIYFGANTKTAIPTAQARGAALVACAYKGLEYGEYTPMQIKQALVGTGAADKHQVQYMVRAVLELDHEPKPDHAADALAAAITHARMRKAHMLEQEFESRAEAGQMRNTLSAKESRDHFNKRVAAALEKERAAKIRPGS